MNHVKFTCLVDFFNFQSMSQTQFLRDDVYSIFNFCYMSYLKKNVSEYQPDFSKFVNTFTVLFLGYTKQTAFYGKSYIGWRILKCILSEVTCSKIEDKIIIVYNVFNKSEHIYHFIERLCGVYENERETSYFILKHLFQYQPSIFTDKLVRRLFDFGINLASSSKMDNEYNSSLFFKLLSYASYEKISNNISSCCSLSPQQQNTRCFLMNFLLETFDTLLNQVKTPRFHLSSYSLHGIVASLRGIFSDANSEIKEQYAVKTSIKLLNFLSSVMPIIRNIVPEGFVMDQLSLDIFQDFKENKTTQELQMISHSFFNLIWRSSREACMFLALASEFLIENLDLISSQQPSTMSTLLAIQDTLLSILTESHHLGLYGVTFEIFKDYCTHAWKNEILAEKLEHIIMKILEELDINSQGNAVPKIATRRSAGLPYCIEAIILACPRFKQSSLVDLFANRIFIILKKEITNKSESKNAAISLYIQRHLFNSSKISALLFDHIAKFMDISINGISSSIWEIKNSSILLFSSLVRNLFGGHRGQGSKLSFTQFHQLFPNFYKTIDQKIRKFSKFEVKPSDYSLLTCFLLILKRLSPIYSCSSVVLPPIQSKEIKDIFSDNFMNCFEMLLICPNYKIRILSIECLFLFSQYEQLLYYFLHAFIKIEINLRSKISFNFIHGYLLLMSAVIEYFKTIYSSATPEINNLIDKLYYGKTYDLGFVNNKLVSCPPCHSLFISILFTLNSIKTPISGIFKIFFDKQNNAELNYRFCSLGNSICNDSSFDSNNIMKYIGLLRSLIVDNRKSEQDYSKIVQIIYESDFSNFNFNPFDFNVLLNEISKFATLNCTYLIKLKLFYIFFQFILHQSFELNSNLIKQLLADIYCDINLTSKNETYIQ
ncbi:hypothetical protein HZS_3044, partial [Henneguya salminicola]